jgi:hypothetical protein
MFVCDEDGIEVFGAGASLLQAGFKIAQPQSAINEQSGGVHATLGFNQSGVAGAAAA